MGSAATRRALRLALALAAATGAALIVVLGCAPGARSSADLVVAQPRSHWPLVTRVLPDSPSWDAGVRPGDVLVRGTPRSPSTAMLVVVRTPQGQTIVVPARALSPLRQLLLGALALLLIGLGTLVLLKSPDRAAGTAFWVFCLLIGITLGAVPAGVRGDAWAIIFTYVTLRVFGPALLEVALAFRDQGHPVHLHGRLWLPSLLLLLAVPLWWALPAHVFPLVQAVAYSVLAAYILGACGVVVAVAVRRPLTAPHREQLQLLALGLTCGFGPFVVLTVLPLLLVRQVLTDATVSSLAIALFPLSIGGAILRTEFLGITSLVHRRTLHLVLRLSLLLVVAGATAAAVAAGQARGWPAPLLAAAAALAVALLFAPTAIWLVRQGERLVLRDTYDTGGTLLEISADLARASAEEVGPLVVTRLVAVLDVSCVLLATEAQVWFAAHPRSTIPPAVREAMQAQTRVLLTHAHPTGEMSLVRLAQVPIMVVPILDGGSLRAVLYLGPKRGGDRYTRQDRALLATLGRHVGSVLRNHMLSQQLADQITTLQRLVAERTALGERVRTSAEEERRRLAGALHDDAVQLSDEIVRSLSDLVALAPLPAAVRDRLVALALLSEDLATSLRAVVSALYPPQLEVAGLVPVLRALLAEAEQRTGCACILVVDPALESQRWPTAVEATLYAIVREAVSNVLHHAQATRLCLELCRVGDRLHLRVHDDGQGFTPLPPGCLVATGHVGLQLLHDRAQALGGTVSIDSAPGRGTCLLVDVALPRGSEGEALS